MLATVTAAAQPAASRGWEVGATLDLAATSRALALGQREQGLALGHSDVSARGPLGRHLQAQVTVAAHTDEGRTEIELEEAWLQTRTLPAGLQLRLGRFASQISPLNEQHPHADDFVERPLLYRAFFGGHWFDDGLRLNWTAPTPFYLSLGAEFLRGRQLIPEAATARSPGATTLSARLGGDIGSAQSWQLSLGHLRNRREALREEAHEEGEEEHGEEGSGHDHDHAHGARYSGARTWLVGATWKWAPGGNNRQQQLLVNVERARISGLGALATRNDRHEATTLAVVWRLSPGWELGARSDWLKVRVPHEDHFDSGRLREHALMLAFKPTHLQTLRLQASTQRGAQEIEGAARRSLQLQYVLSFGAHGAHAF